MHSHIHPLKRFSQHLLKNKSIAKKMIDALSITDSDTVVEIGPGTGILTQFLLSSPADRIIAVEIDTRMTRLLKDQFNHYTKFTLIENDFLKVNFESFLMDNKTCRVVGNLPYAITSPILFRLLDHRQRIRDVTVTVQKEVAERIVSPPGTKTYGIPSVFFQLFSEVKILFKIPRNAFYPVPKVDSAVLQICFLDEPVHPVNNWPLFQSIVRTAFQQRRKMLRNSIKVYLDGLSITDTSSIDLSLRPEQLSVKDWVKLVAFVRSNPTF